MVSFQAEHLRTFLVVLETGTFEAAAQTLHVTASAISQRIKAMEQTAGQTLLQRSTPIAPSAAGLIVQRLARQMRQLEYDAARDLGINGTGRGHLSVVVNADSLATWFLDALALLPGTGLPPLEILREDEHHSASLLRSGEVMAAVTATAQPVQGCSTTPLGALTYFAVAAPAFIDTWFPEGFSGEALAAAPALNYDRSDTLQSNFLAQFTACAATGPQHYLPDTLQLARAISDGLGWGLMPQAHARPGLAGGTLRELVPGRVTRVELFWQRWKIASSALDALTSAVTQAAASGLDH